jgi:hypothetical protein
MAKAGARGARRRRLAGLVSNRARGWHEVGEQGGQIGFETMGAWGK